MASRPRRIGGELAHAAAGCPIGAGRSPFEESLALSAEWHPKGRAVRGHDVLVIHRAAVPPDHPYWTVRDWEASTLVP